MAWTPRQPQRRRYSRSAPIVMLVALAALLAIPAIDAAVQRAWDSAPTRWPDGRIRIEAEFGR